MYDSEGNLLNGTKLQLNYQPYNKEVVIEFI